MTEDEEQAIRADIACLRRAGGKDNLAAADRLEVRLVVLKRQVDRIEQLTVDKLKEWVSEIVNELHGKALDDLRAWPKHLRQEMFQALQLAWAASRFRIRETADLLGVSPRAVAEWVESEDYRVWSTEAGPRSMRVIAVADLALSRMGHLLSIETNDPKMLELQLRAASTVMTAGVTLPGKTKGPEEPAKKRSLPAIDGEVVERQKKVRVIR